MKRILLVIILFIQVTLSAQNDSIPGTIDTTGIIEYSADSVQKGGNLNFEFFTSFNQQVSLKLYSGKGVLISTTSIEVFSERGLALTTRSIDVGTYYMCLKLKTKTLIKKVSISP